MTNGAESTVLTNDETEACADGLRAAEKVPLEVLERNLTSHAAHLAAAEAQWLGWLGEYCVRKGWREWGCSRPVQWLSWQCGMSPTTARDKVLVAVALRSLPVVAKRFAQGRLSYSKVRALTRVATPDSDAELADLGVAATGAQLDLIVRSFRKALDADKGAASAWRTRSLRSRSDGDETSVFTLRIPNHDADLGVGVSNGRNRAVQMPTVIIEWGRAELVRLSSPDTERSARDCSPPISLGLRGRLASCHSPRKVPLSRC